MEGDTYQIASAFSVPIRALTAACYQYDSGFKKTTHQLNGLGNRTANDALSSSRPTLTADASSRASHPRSISYDLDQFGLTFVGIWHCHLDVIKIRRDAGNSHQMT
jgi:hypothetical protein